MSLRQIAEFLIYSRLPEPDIKLFRCIFRLLGVLAGILGGMIAPSLLAKLIGTDVLHKWYYVPIVYAGYCAAAMVALLFIRETRDIRLEDLDSQESNGAPRLRIAAAND